MNKPAEQELDMAALVELDRDHVWHHLTPHKPMKHGSDPVQRGKDPLVIVRGEGMKVWDQNGKEHLDAVSGAVWTVNVGYGRESIANAVRDQLIEMCYFAGSAGNVPGIRYAEKLISKMPGMSRVYYSNSGSEANEKGYKIVRQLAARDGGRKHKILYRERDYHGTTITALSSGGQDERKAQYGPFTPGFVEVPHCCEYRAQFEHDGDYGVRIAREYEKIIEREDPDTIGSIVLEPMTAGGGVIPPPEGYWETVQEICRKHQILLHIDEVVCGLGRTGKWFGYQHYGIKPDIVTMAKGVASGYAAIACTVTTEELFERFRDTGDDTMDYFRDISTFGGCAAGPAAALETMRIIEDENLLENVTEMSEYLMERLRGLQNKHEVIGDVRGKGLFCGMELVKDRITKEPVHESMLMKITGDCMENGVIVGRTNRSLAGFNNTLCLSPALIVGQAEIDLIVDTIDAAMERHAKV